MMIFPTPAKQNSSLGSPYADLFREFQSRIVREQSVLITAGYAFGDEHLNHIIYQALTIPTFRLIIFAEPDSDGEIGKLRDLNDPRIWIIGGDGPRLGPGRIISTRSSNTLCLSGPASGSMTRSGRCWRVMGPQKSEETMSHDDRKRAVGKVISVAADRFVIEMHAGTDNFTVVGFDDIHYVARLGSFLMIPAQTEYVVAEVVGLRERDVRCAESVRWRLRQGSSAKFLDVVPVGMLPLQGGGKFRFGVSVFPSLYADALMRLIANSTASSRLKQPLKLSSVQMAGPASRQTLRAIRVLGIGQSVIFEDYEVKVRLDDFFGGHVAVLGNTGSGKSCTVASVLQALFEKPDEHHARGATFVIFDVNGEYHEALEPLSAGGRIGDRSGHPRWNGHGFRLPHWFLDLSEWELLLQASERTQLPILRMALGLSTMFSQAGAADAHWCEKSHPRECITQIMATTQQPVEARRGSLAYCSASTQTRSIRELVRGYIRINFGQYGRCSGARMNSCVGEHGFVIDDLKLPDYENIPFDFHALGEP